MNADLTTTTELAVDSQPVSQTVVLAVAEATGDDAMELPPLYDTVDPDALNRLFEDRTDSIERLGGSFEFAYAGCDVTVRADGTVDVVLAADTAVRTARAVTSD